MNTFKLGFLQIWHRKTRLFIQWLMVVMGLGLISGFFTVQSSADDQLVRDLGPVDQVWCAKGSPLRGLLANVYHIDAASGNISNAEVMQYAQNPMVERVTRIAYGDVYRAKRILGADASWRELYQLKLSEGRWNENTLEVVLSKSLADELNLELGSHFHGQHGDETNGHEHEQDYEVVGIFSNSGTVADRLLITNLESVWDVHDLSESERDITAALVEASPMALFQLPKVINKNSTFQAVLPSIEVSRIYELFSGSQRVFIALSILFLILGGLSIAITLHETIRAQQFDHTLLRIFGIRPNRLALLIWTQTLILMISAWVIGMVAVKASLFFSADYILQSQGVYIAPPSLVLLDFKLLLLAIGLAVIIAIPPVLRIFGSTIHENLKNA